MSSPGQQHALVADLFRRESGRLIAILTARVGAARIDAVEDAVQDALVKAIGRWPMQGVPDNPSAWLYTIARNALTDRLRRSKHETTGDSGIELADEAVDPGLPSEESLGDEQLRLIVYCCHPALSQAAQLALTLRLACGLGVEEIAGALLTTPESISQRIVRAKRALRARGVVFELPPAHELVNDRLPGILNALYLLFSAGYLSVSHHEWLRPALCADAVRLARLLATTPVTAEPEAQALAALLHLTAARLPARTSDSGQPIPLAQQDRTKWDQTMIAAGYSFFASAIRGSTLTRYHIEAAIASVHARATGVEDTDWEEIVGHYDQLCALYPSPVASLNRIIALRYARGAQAALDALCASDTVAQLQDSLMLHAAVAELYDALGDHRSAADAFRAAAELAGSGSLAELFRSREQAAMQR
jgi:RNA polymerase sigma-70 factor (ECF subfamily)